MDGPKRSRLENILKIFSLQRLKKDKMMDLFNLNIMKKLNALN